MWPVNKRTFMCRLCSGGTASLSVLNSRFDKLAAPRGMAALAVRLPALDSFRLLQIRHYQLEGCGAALAALPASLRLLDISRCMLDDGAAVALAGRVPALTALEEAKLGDGSCGCTGAVVAALPPSLRVLTVSLTEAAAAALADRVTALAALEQLELQGDCGASTALLMAALPPSLHNLFLGGCNFGSGGAAALVACAPALRALWCLIVPGQHFSFKQAAALSAPVPASCD